MNNVPILIPIVAKAARESRETQGAEVPGIHCGRWRQRSGFALGSVPVAFPCDKEEGAVLAIIELRNRERTAGRSAELVLPQGRAGCLEEAARIHHLVAQELPKVAMVLVGSGFRDHAHCSSGGAAVLGQIVMPLALELLNRIDDGRIVVCPGQRVQVIRPVEKENIAAVARAVHCREAELPDRRAIPPAASTAVLVGIEVHGTGEDR